MNNKADVGHTHLYAGSSSVGGPANSATKLATGRTIGVGTAVTSIPKSFNGESNITIPIDSVKESYLDWGGKGLSGNVSPIGMSLSDEHSANRLAFINGNALTMEYSSDGGSTYKDYGYSAADKSAFCTLSKDIPIGRTSGAYCCVCLEHNHGFLYLYRKQNRMERGLNGSSTFCNYHWRGV